MKLRCPKPGCAEELTPSMYFYCYDCPTHGAVSVEDAEHFNHAERVVWVREPRAVYTKTIPARDCLPDGKIATEGLTDFTWEPWP